MSEFVTASESKAVTAHEIFNTNKPTATASPKPVIIPDPKVELRIGMQKQGMSWDKHTTTSSDCTTGEAVKLNVRVDIPTEMYGYWTVENMKSDYKVTCTCGFVVGSKEDRSVHGSQTGHTSYTIRTKGNSAFDANVWHPDNTPCNLVYSISLPEGMEVAENSVSIAQVSFGGDILLDAVDASNYAVSVNGRNLTVNIGNIKTGGFCYSHSGKVMYRPIVASFSTKMSEAASAVNSVNASVSYSCGQNSKTLQTNTVTINKK